MGATREEFERLNEIEKSRRTFLSRGVRATAGSLLAGAPASLVGTERPPIAEKSDISLAQWALVDEMRAGRWKNADFPRIAREDFGIGGIEFVNTLFDVPTVHHLNHLKQNCKDHGVTMVLIMVDCEGDGAEPTKELRRQFAINHRKWIDIAHYLGCHAIRTNCRGPARAKPDECMKWARESYRMLLDYAEGSKVRVSIENHGGVSNDADWLLELVESVNHPLFCTYPDWREPSREFDNVAFVRKTIPYAAGTSYRNQPSEEQSAEMIRICQSAGYRGWYGIESSGRKAIQEGVRILRKYL